jgi:ribosome-associated translation inhibitor RaiA
MSGVAMKITYAFRKNIAEKINRMPSNTSIRARMAKYLAV